MSTLTQNPLDIIRESETDPLSRTQIFFDDDIFYTEQKKFARNAWNLLCVTADVAKEDDFLAVDLGGNSVVLQKSHDKIIGFQNVCSNGFHPIYRRQSGNASLHCSTCNTTPSLLLIETEVCGSLVFGKLPTSIKSAHLRQGLRGYLGNWTDAIEALIGNDAVPITVIEQVATANWKFSYQLTLDDYHIVQIHSNSFGMGGHLKPGSWRYAANGIHSALSVNRNGVPQNWCEQFIESCHQGMPPMHSYVIFQVFPNVVVILIEHDGLWLVLISRYLALTVEQTAIKTWFFLAPGQSKNLAISEKMTGAITMWTQIYNEDTQAAEHLQSALKQTTDMPYLAAAEERIGWFERAYREFMLDGVDEAAKLRTSSA